MTFGCPNRLYLTHREGRRTGWNVFALEDGDVYYTYSRTAPDRFLLAQSYSQHSTMSPTDATRTSRCDAMRSTRGIGASGHRRIDASTCPWHSRWSGSEPAVVIAPASVPGLVLRM